MTISTHPRPVDQVVRDLAHEYDLWIHRTEVKVNAQLADLTGRRGAAFVVHEDGRMREEAIKVVRDAFVRDDATGALRRLK